MSIGEELRQAREEIGASIAEIERVTKIRARYLTALEEEDFDLLPGKVYVKGFLRVYGRLLGLDENHLVSQYESQFASHSAQDELQKIAKTIDDTYRPIQDDVRLTTSWRVRIVIGVVFFLAVIIYQGMSTGWFSSTTDDNGQDPGISVSEENGAGQEEVLQPVSDPVQYDTASSVAPEGLKIVLQAEGLSWVSVAVDNETVFEGNLNPGDLKEFVGQEGIYLIMGSAGAVKVEINGQDHGFLGGTGEVVERSFTLNDGQI